LGYVPCQRLTVLVNWALLAFAGDRLTVNQKGSDTV